MYVVIPECRAQDDDRNFLRFHLLQTLQQRFDQRFAERIALGVIVQGQDANIFTDFRFDKSHLVIFPSD